MTGMLSGLRDAINRAPGAALARKALGYITLSDRYLADLAEESLLERGLTTSQRAEYQAAKRDAEEASGSLLARAESHAERLGREYRRGVESEAVKGVVAKPQAQEEAENLLLGLKQATSGQSGYRPKVTERDLPRPQQGKG